MINYKINAEESLDLTLKFLNDQLKQKTSYQIGKNSLDAIFYYGKAKIDLKVSGYPEYTHIAISVYKAHNLEIPLEIFSGDSEKVYKYLGSLAEVLEAVLENDPTGKIHEIITDRFPEFRERFFDHYTRVRRITDYLSEHMKWKIAEENQDYLVDYGHMYAYTLKSDLNTDIKLPLACFREHTGLKSSTTLYLEKLTRPQGMSSEDYTTVCEYMSRVVATFGKQIIYEHTLKYSNFHEEFLEESLSRG
jgi:hypothetical protein